MKRPRRGVGRAAGRRLPPSPPGPEGQSGWQRSPGMSPARDAPRSAGRGPGSPTGPTGEDTLGTKRPGPCPTPCLCSLSSSCPRDTLGAKMSHPMSLFPAQGTCWVPKCPIPCPTSQFPVPQLPKGHFGYEPVPSHTPCPVPPSVQGTRRVPKCPTPCPTSQFPLPQLPKGHVGYQDVPPRVPVPCPPAARGTPYTNRSPPPPRANANASLPP